MVEVTDYENCCGASILYEFYGEGEFDDDLDEYALKYADKNDILDAIREAPTMMLTAILNNEQKANIGDLMFECGFKLVFETPNRAHPGNTIYLYALDKSTWVDPAQVAPVVRVFPPQAAPAPAPAPRPAVVAQQVALPFRLRAGAILQIRDRPREPTRTVARYRMREGLIDCVGIDAPLSIEFARLHYVVVAEAVA